MRVLELTDLYPPDIGGTQRHVARQSEELARRGHEVTVLTHAVGDAPLREMSPEGVTVIRTEAPWFTRAPGLYENVLRRHSAPAPEVQDLRMIRGLIDEQHPDVVLAHNWIIYSYLPIKRREDPPVIWILHDYSASCHKKTVLYSSRRLPSGSACPGPRLDRCIPCGTEQYGLAKSVVIALGLRGSRGLLNSRVDLTVAVSSAVAEVSQIAFDHPIRVIPSFLADGLQEVASRQPRPGFCPDGEYLLFVGSTDRHKGLDVLIKAYRGIDARIPLVVIATTSSAKEHDFGPGVTVVANAPHDQVMGAWKYCTLGVVPSIWEEPWGQVAAEAATVGKAVVASRVGGLQEVVIDGVTGRLVPPNDVPALREAIDHLLASPDERLLMGRRAAEHVRPFTVSIVTDQIEQAISDAIEHRSSLA